MIRKSSKYLVVLLLFVACGGNTEKDDDEITYWRYKRPEKEKKRKELPKMSFRNIKKTIGFKSTKDSTVVGIWLGYNDYIDAFICKNDSFFLWEFLVRDGITSSSISECTFLCDTLNGKTIFRRLCGEYEHFYYAISYPDSLWMYFYTHNDSLAGHYRNEKISHVMQPIEEKRARYKLYAERDTLTIGWYRGTSSGHYRLIGKDGNMYIMTISNYGYDVVKLITSPHPKGTRLDYIPWNTISEMLFKNTTYYDVLSKDSSILYEYNSLNEELITEHKRYENYKHNTWVDEHLFGGEKGGDEPWR